MEKAVFSKHLSRMCGGDPGTRRRGTTFKDFNFQTQKHRTEIAGDRYTLREMTLILDKDTGNTEDL